jgi:1,4-alpha-glucan branching enzyme
LGRLQWIDFHDLDHSVVSLVRRAHDPNDLILAAVNFTPVPLEGYRIGVPVAGFYRELLNSDSANFGGANIGNEGGRHSEPVPWQGQAQSILLTLPPLALLCLKPD